MTEITINLEDYMSTETMSEIAEEEFRFALRSKLNANGGVDRILSNISYYAVFDEIDRVVENGGDSIREKIREWVFDTINKGRNYGIFRSKTPYQDASTATKIVEELLHQKRDLIRDRVTQCIKDMPMAAIKDEIKYVLHEQIDNILNGVDDD